MVLSFQRLTFVELYKILGELYKLYRYAYDPLAYLISIFFSLTIMSFVVMLSDKKLYSVLGVT